MKWDQAVGARRENIDDRRFDEPVVDPDGERLLSGLPQNDSQFERRLQQMRDWLAYKQNTGAAPMPPEQRQPTNAGGGPTPIADSAARVRELVGAQPPQQQSRVQLVGETEEALIYRDHTGRQITVPKSLVKGG